jgi:flagellin-like protein
MKNHRKSKRALSPVVASIILIAVTVAVSIAVAAWMGALSVGFMQTEQLQLKTPVFGDGSTTPFYSIDVTNTGTSSVVITGVSINGVTITAADINGNAGASSTTNPVPYTLKPNAVVTVEISATNPAVLAGNNYQVTIVTSKNNQFSVNAIAPQ